MSVIKFENISKEYNIGSIGSGTLSHDLNRFFSKIMGKEDPNAKIKEHATDKKKSNQNIVKALDNINFEINKGEIGGFIGKNGAGKSTLLKLLSKVTTPSSGNIFVSGKVASLLEVGTGFHPELTGKENVFLNGAILGMTRKEIAKKFDEIVEFSGVSAYIDTPVKRYSSGMYVRLAFSVAAHLDTDILIVDEVLAVGDYEFQQRCIGKMGDVANTGKTVLFVSHQIDLIYQLCDRAILLDKGTIIKDGEVKHVIDHYYNLRENNDLPLKDRQDRQGTLEIKIIDCFLRTRNEERASYVQIGDELKIIIQVEVQGEFDDVNLSCGIIDKRQNNICELATRTINQNMNFSEAGNYELEVIIPRWQINAGTYDVNFMINKHTLLFDWIKSAINFEVKFGDFYGTNRLPDAERMLLMDYKWECKKL
jgi:lipopolysaccharide transport system ATP-binding protein